MALFCYCNYAHSTVLNAEWGKSLLWSLGELALIRELSTTSVFRYSDSMWLCGILFPFTATILFFFAHSIAFLLVSKENTFFFFHHRLYARVFWMFEILCVWRERGNNSNHQMIESESTINGYSFSYLTFCGANRQRTYSRFDRNLTHTSTHSHMIPLSAYKQTPVWQMSLELYRNRHYYALIFDSHSHKFAFDIAIGRNITSQFGQTWDNCSRQEH